MIDQILHILLGFLSNLPFLGAFIVVNEREYYQRKRTMEKVWMMTPALAGKEPKFRDVMRGYKWFKKDLAYGYIGVVSGGCLMLWLLFK